jgi:hypothetical protein
MNKCPFCHKERKSLARHWNGECGPIKLTPYQRDVVYGILMGDGYIDSSSGMTPLLDIEMTNKKYLEYIDDIFGIVSSGVSKRRDPSDGREIERNNSTYRLRTMRLPLFDKYVEWYESGEKKIPEKDISGTSLKHWYVCDGTREKRRSRIRISICNERKRKSAMENIFSSFNVSPTWNESKRKNKYGGWRCSAVFTQEESRKLWRVMGSPPPGFEYKWP